MVSKQVGISAVAVWQGAAEVCRWKLFWKCGLIDRLAARCMTAKGPVLRDIGP